MRTAGVAAAAAGAVLLLAGCGQVPDTVSLEEPTETVDTPLPVACLGPGLNLAIGYGTYAVPLDGEEVTGDDVPAALGGAVAETPLVVGSTYTLCAYVSDHPSPFSVRGGDDSIVCVIVDPAGEAEVLDTRRLSDGAADSWCRAQQEQPDA